MPNCAPAIFSERNCGKALVNRTSGTKIASEGLRGRVFEVCLADLNKDEDQAFRKIRLCAEEIQGNQIVTGFHGMAPFSSAPPSWSSIRRTRSNLGFLRILHLRMYTFWSG
ncbi:40S ribosomal protein S3a [Phytophthora ramorum]